MEGVTILATGTAMLGISWGGAIIIALIVFVIMYALNPLEDDFGWRIGFATLMFVLSCGPPTQPVWKARFPHVKTQTLS